MLSDAHLHCHDLASVVPGTWEDLLGSDLLFSASSHAEEEFLETETRLGPLLGGRAVLTFGIHPQWPVWRHRDLLGELARSGRIAAIGEAGFDFFGDRPERVRTPENEALQTAVFEYQLGLAEETGLPLLVHLRKATDLVFRYTRRLARLRGVVFHAWPGTAREARDLLGRGLSAWFSLGTPLLRGRKQTRECAALLPLDRLLSETDAPWQPLKGRDHTGLDDLGTVQAEMAALRGLHREVLEQALECNFRGAYGLPSA